jgi:alpha-tubulin suppressor-like RCC1 family protein
MFAHTKHLAKVIFLFTITATAIGCQYSKFNLSTGGSSDTPTPPGPNPAPVTNPGVVQITSTLSTNMVAPTTFNTSTDMGTLNSTQIVFSNTGTTSINDLAVSVTLGADFTTYSTCIGVLGSGQSCTYALYLQNSATTKSIAQILPTFSYNYSGTSFTAVATGAVYVRFIEPIRYIEVKTGLAFTCALNLQHKIYCWGSNSEGQLGNGTQSNDPTTEPILVTTATGLVSPASLFLGAKHACAIQGSDIYCWGKNKEGELGDGTTANSFVPILVTKITGLIHPANMALGSYHTCAIQGNSIYCWGYNEYGQLGNGTTNDITKTPMLVTTSTGLTKPTQLAAGGNSTCSLSNNIAYCWGYNLEGQLGDGTTIDRWIPTLVNRTTGLTHASQIALNTAHACAISNGQAYCWGYNLEGQLGDGTTIDRWIPTLVNRTTGLLDVTEIAVGGLHTCAVTNGETYCWGLNSSGQIGNNTTTVQFNTPTAVSQGTGLYNATSIDLGDNYTCGVSNNTIYCWGDNYTGELGNGTETDAKVPSLVIENYIF